MINIFKKLAFALILTTNVHAFFTFDATNFTQAVMRGLQLIKDGKLKYDEFRAMMDKVNQGIEAAKMFKDNPRAAASQLIGLYTELKKKYSGKRKEEEEEEKKKEEDLAISFDIMPEVDYKPIKRTNKEGEFDMDNRKQEKRMIKAHYAELEKEINELMGNPHEDINKELKELGKRIKKPASGDKYNMEIAMNNLQQLLSKQIMVAAESRIDNYNNRVMLEKFIKHNANKELIMQREELDNTASNKVPYGKVPTNPSDKKAGKKEIDMTRWKANKK